MLPRAEGLIEAFLFRRFCLYPLAAGRGKTRNDRSHRFPSMVYYANLISAEGDQI